jgi:hypothetical protein
MTQRMINDSKIQIQIEGRLRLVDRDLFAATHQRLAEEGREQGLSGHALDCEIARSLPHRLAQLLDGGVVLH